MLAVLLRPAPPSRPGPSLSAPICVDTSSGSLALCLLMVSQEVPVGKGKAGGEPGCFGSLPHCRGSTVWAVVGPLCDPGHAPLPSPSHHEAQRTPFLSSPRCRAGLCGQQ